VQGRGVARTEEEVLALDLLASGIGGEVVLGLGNGDLDNLARGAEEALLRGHVLLGLDALVVAEDFEAVILGTVDILEVALGQLGVVVNVVRAEKSAIADAVVRGGVGSPVGVGNELVVPVADALATKAAAKHKRLAGLDVERVVLVDDDEIAERAHEVSAGIAVLVASGKDGALGKGGVIVLDANLSDLSTNLPTPFVRFFFFWIYLWTLYLVLAVVFVPRDNLPDVLLGAELLGDVRIVFDLALFSADTADNDKESLVRASGLDTDLADASEVGARLVSRKDLCVGVPAEEVMVADLRRFPLKQHCYRQRE